MMTIKPDHETQTTTETVRQWIGLRDLRDAYREQLKEVESQLAELGEHIKADFLAHGRTKDTVDGVTVHVRYDVRVSARNGDREAACDLLTDIGLASLVTADFNTNTLKSVVKEIRAAADRGDDQARAQLQRLESVFNIYEVFDLGARKAGVSRSGERFLNQTERE